MIELVSTKQWFSSLIIGLTSEAFVKGPLFVSMLSFSAVVAVGPGPTVSRYSTFLVNSIRLRYPTRVPGTSTSTGSRYIRATNNGNICSDAKFYLRIGNYLSCDVLLVPVLRTGRVSGLVLYFVLYFVVQKSVRWKYSLPWKRSITIMIRPISSSGSVCTNNSRKCSEYRDSKIEKMRKGGGWNTPQQHISHHYLVSIFPTLLVLVTILQ